MPLAELALSVGFQAQAHFSAVYKRFTGGTSARQRRTHQLRQLAEPFLHPAAGSDGAATQLLNKIFA